MDTEETSHTEEMEKTSDSPPHNDFAAEDSSFESSSETETSVVATPPHSAAVKAETPFSSPTKTTSEPSTPPRKSVVSVKNIESINASVPNTPNASPSRTQSGEMTSGGSKVDESIEVRPPVSSTADVKVSPKSLAVVSSISATLPKTQNDVPVCDASLSEEDFDLSKVKDEPLDDQELPNDVDVIKIPKPSVVSQSTSSAASAPASAVVNRIRRQFELFEETQPLRKVKPDSKCRTVNITENVTLSLVNQSAPSEPPKPRPPTAVVKQKPAKAVPSAVPLVIPATAAIFVNTSTTTPSTSRLNYNNSAPNDINILRAKVTTPTALPVSNSVVTVNRPNTKVQPRVVNQVLQTNGMLCVSTKPAVTVTPSRSSSKVSDSYNDFFNKVMNESLTEVSIAAPKSLFVPSIHLHRPPSGALRNLVGEELSSEFII